MKNKILVLVILTCMLYGSKAQNKIGYINVDKVFSVLPETAKADSALASYQENWAKEYEKEKDELQKAYNKFATDSTKMTQQEKSATRKKINDALVDNNNKGQQFNQLIEQEKEKLIKPIREKIIKVIQEYAKQNGYAHILYESNALLLNTEDDVTTKIIEKLKSK